MTSGPIAKKKKLVGIQEIEFSTPPSTQIHGNILFPKNTSDWLQNMLDMDSNLNETLSNRGGRETLIQNLLHAFYDARKRFKHDHTSPLAQPLGKARQTQETNKSLVENVEP
ncbi:hypothetical protein BDW74DRAFT_183550 [Aspergillus multicolor]|uniref:uncharacterized protein n=1 Tax=Aspergillus multicolor TaxID=41759 RepID=UPI003CCE5388